MTDADARAHGRATARFAAGIAAGAGLLVLAAWVLCRHRPPSPEPARLPVPSPRSSLAAEEARADAIPGGDADEAGFTRVTQERSGPGVVHLRVVEGETGEPVPRLRFAVYCEKTRDCLLGRGTTDARGEAVLRDLPLREVVAIETERRPP